MKDKFCVKKKNVAADCRHFFIPGWVWHWHQRELFLQEIINSKTKDMKMNFVKMRWLVHSSMGQPCRD